MAAVMTIRGVPVGCTTRHPVPTTARRAPCTSRPGRSHRVAAATYRRRRLVAVLLALGVLVAAGRAGAALGGSTLAAPGPRPQVVTYVVQSGDTLWDVAGRVAPGEDPRRVVDALAGARRGTGLVPGETITWLAG